MCELYKKYTQSNRREEIRLRGHAICNSDHSHKLEKKRQNVFMTAVRSDEKENSLLLSIKVGMHFYHLT